MRRQSGGILSAKVVNKGLKSRVKRKIKKTQFFLKKILTNEFECAIIVNVAGRNPYGEHTGA